MTDSPDTDAGTTFGSSARSYERLRPEIAAEALDWVLGVRAGATADDGRVLDLAAGTGQVTGPLRERGIEVVAVEPDERMLGELRRRHPDVEALSGRAEAIPLPDASVDACVVASAWHWFDEELAAPEIARVLRDGGRRVGPVATSRFGGRRVMTPSDAAALFTTFSFYRAASPERRMRFDRHIAGVLDAEWSGACEIDMPTVTLASRVVRRGR